MADMYSRRQLMMMGVAGGASLALVRPAGAASAPERPATELIARARAALGLHRASLAHVDRIGIVDFSRPSASARFFILDMADGRTTAHLVAHGRGSDPAHTGWVKLFSNQPGSYASSPGAYATGETYVGAHGRSMRLTGLDPVNNNALSRAIVVHSAWYVTPQMARDTGKIGRSEGCFAVSTGSLDEVLTRLGPGRLLYADKI